MQDMILLITLAMPTLNHSFTVSIITSRLLRIEVDRRRKAHRMLHLAAMADTRIFRSRA
jgi:hypothetical protein